jgi:hypothetical protein
MAHDGPFPSSERLSRPGALLQLEGARKAQQGPFTLDRVSAPTAVINEHRQVIFANRAFLDTVKAGSVEDLCGERPGEILRCVHAGSGCGESEACRYCGAALAILETQNTHQEVTRQCHITSVDPERESAYDLQVHTTPFELDGKSYILLGFQDISHQNRRAALERIFFHDILNTTSSFKVYLELLRRAVRDEGSRGLILRLQAISETLEEEIKGQKLILAAESHTLQVQRNLMESSTLAAQLVGQSEGLPAAKEHPFVVKPFSESFSFISDDSLVKRVLGNMLKNALEASPPGGQVAFGFGKSSDGHVWFQVHNEGFMEPLVQKQVFRRYFSTKGEGRGLGTWGMRLLTEEYLGGKVTFSSAVETGTTFTLTLPTKPASL